MTGQDIQKIPPTPKPADDDRQIGLDEWDDMVADKYKVPRSLMKSVRGQESSGDVNAVSPRKYDANGKLIGGGVKGRYQVTEATAKQYGLDRNDPWQQSVAAAKHLRKMFDESQGADDDEKWLGAVGKYYGGSGAVKNGELSGQSLDGLSNPAEHVRRVAEKWGEIRRAERGQQSPTTSQPSTTDNWPATNTKGRPYQPPSELQKELKAQSPQWGQDQIFDVGTGKPKPMAQASKKLPAPRAARNVFAQGNLEQRDAMSQARGMLNFRPAGGEQARIQEEANRLDRQLSPQFRQQRAEREARVAQRRAEYNQMSPARQRLSDIGTALATTGQQGQQAFENLLDIPNPALAGASIRSVANRIPGVASRFEQGKEAQTVTAQNLAEEQLAADSLRSKAMRGITGAAAGGTIIAPVAMAGGIPAVMGATGLQQDWRNDPEGALVQTVGSALPILGGKAISPIAGRVAGAVRPGLQKATQLGIEGGAGAATGAGQYAAGQALLGRPVDPEEALVQAGTGLGQSMAMAPRMNAPRRMAPATLSESPVKVGAQMMPPAVSEPMPARPGYARRPLEPGEPSKPVQQRMAQFGPTEKLAPVGGEASMPQAEALPEISTGRRIIERTRDKAESLIQEGKYQEAVAELKAHQQALRDEKSQARGKAGLRAQLEREIGLTGNRIGEVRKMARNAPKGQPAQPVKEVVTPAEPLTPEVPKIRTPETEAPTTGLTEEFATPEQKPQEGKRIISRIAELGGLNMEKHGGEMQSAKDARRIGLLRKEGVSPDLMARQLKSEGYDVDPENLNTLWDAINRDVAGKEQPLKDWGTADLEKREGQSLGDYYENLPETPQRPPTEPLQSEQPAQVKIMLTRDDHQQLADLGYSRAERDAMTPDEGARIITEGKTKTETEQAEPFKPDTEEPPTGRLVNRPEAVNPRFENVQGIRFKTAQGSEYVFREGRTQRNKTPHEGLEHQGDVGIKPVSDKTLFIPSKDAQEVGMWNTSSAQGKRIVHNGDEILLTSINGKTGQRGVDYRIQTHQKEPAKGLSPLELWGADESGYYRRNHPGNEITEIANTKANPLESAYQKLGSRDPKQLAEILRAGDRRYRLSSTEMERAIDQGAYERIKQLTPEEHEALRGILPERGFYPSKENHPEGRGDYSRHVRDIRMGEDEPAQLLKNFDELMEAFGTEEGRAKMDAEIAAKHVENTARAATNQDAKELQTVIRLSDPVKGNKRWKELYEKVTSGEANQNDLANFRRLSKQSFLSDEFIAHAVERGSATEKAGVPRNAPNPEAQAPEALRATGTEGQRGAVAPKTVSHPDPAIDGKPIIAETKDGRVIVPNDANQSGVSVVKNRAEQSNTAKLDEINRLERFQMIDRKEAQRRRQALEAKPQVREQRAESSALSPEHDAPQIATDARLTYKPGRRGAGGVIYVNDQARAILRGAHEELTGEQSYISNFNMNKGLAKKMSDIVMAEARDLSYPVEARRQFEQIANVLKGVSVSNDRTVSVVHSEGREGRQVAISRRHELFHDAQEDLKASPDFLTKHEHGQKLIDRLAEMGYDIDQRPTEAAAFIAGGQAKDFGLTESQGKQFIRDYFDDVVKNNGAEALERFVHLAREPRAALREAKQAAYGIKGQNQEARGANIGRERGAREAVSGATGRGQEILGGVKEQRPVEGEERPNRSRQINYRALQEIGNTKSLREQPEVAPPRPTGRLASITAESLREGGGGPPKPPRKRRGGGEGPRKPRNTQPEVEEIEKKPEGSMRGRFFETVGSAQAGAQLGTPGFVGRNVLQHMGYAVQSGIADRVAQGIDAAFSKATGTPRRIVIPGNPVSNSLEGLKTYFKGIKEAHRAYRAGETLDSGQIDALKSAPKNKAARAVRGLLTYINEIPDAGNYAARFNRRLKIATATAERNGVPLTEENQASLIAQAKLEAAHDSMRDENFVSKSLATFKESLNKLTKPITDTEKFGLGDFIVKYTQVPGALIKRGIEYSPLGLLESGHHAIKATMGKGSPAEGKMAVQSLARAISGSATTAGMGAALAAMGVLVEPEKDDYTSQQLESERGVRGFSVNLSALGRVIPAMLGGEIGDSTKLQSGDKLMPIDWAQPWAMGASIGATLWNQKKAGKFSASGVARAGWKSFENTLAIMGDQSVLKNIREYIRSAKGNTFQEMAGGAIKKFVKDVPQSFTPGMARQIGSVIDPNVRDYRPENREGIGAAFKEGGTKALAETLPGLSRTYPAKLSPITGDVKRTAKGEMSPLGRVAASLSPAMLNEFKDDKLANEIIKLNEKLEKKDLSLYVPPLSERETKIPNYKEGTGQLRQREQQFAREFAVRGRNLVNQPWWDKKSDEEKAERMRELISSLRQKTYKEGPIAGTIREAQKAQKTRSKISAQP